eukprot:3284707-Rhodomonas_salina.1
MCIRDRGEAAEGREIGEAVVRHVERLDLLEVAQVHHVRELRARQRQTQKRVPSSICAPHASGASRAEEGRREAGAADLRSARKSAARP